MLLYTLTLIAAGKFIMANGPVVMEDERTPLITEHASVESHTVSVNVPTRTSVETQAGNSFSLVYAVLPTLLFGVFIAQADSSVVLATSQDIASEFSALSGASWLITTYTLAQCACQPLVRGRRITVTMILAANWSKKKYGKMSDIFGRKPALVFAYLVFTFGCILWYVLLVNASCSLLNSEILCSGIGTTYWHVLAGRAISGVGGAGMVGLVAVIIAGRW